MAARIKKGDTVEVGVGREAAAAEGHRARGHVMRVIPSRGKIVVEGINRVFRHMRPSRRNPQGGRVQKEAPIDASNAMPVCLKCDRGVRVRFQEDERGRKVRVCVKCQSVLSVVSRAVKQE